MEAVEHHVEEEEKQMFPKSARSSTKTNSIRRGSRIGERHGAS